MRKLRWASFGIIIVIWISCLAGCGQAERKLDADMETSLRADTGLDVGMETSLHADTELDGGMERDSEEPAKKGVSLPWTHGEAGGDAPLDQSQGADAREESAVSAGTVNETGEGMSSEQGEPVFSCGALFVDGTKLVDGDGAPVQLRGISTHGLAWYPGYVNRECFRQLKQEWGMNVVRLAMYTAESGGYCTDGSQSDLKALVKSGVEYATEFDMYVIIDWHILSDGNPNTYIEEAKGFFDEMSKAYAAYDNVMYEICNEPNGGTSWSDIKGYAEQVIEVIRNNDEDGIILVGTPNWSQYVDQAAADPIEGYENIMYTLHFYAATHTDTLRSAMVNAIEEGLPIFVSEYGICDASGNGAIDEKQAKKWLEILDEYQISYVAWNLSNKAETSAVIQSGCDKLNGFAEEDLSDSGKWLYGMLQDAGSGSGLGGSVAGSTDASGEGVDSDAGAGRNPGKDIGSDAGTAKADGKGSDSGIRGTDSSGEGFGTGTKENAGEGAGLHIAADIVNSWEQGGEFYYQYGVTITNGMGMEQNGWTIQIVFSGDITLSDKWNGNYQAEGDTLTISSMDYNGHMAEGGSVGDIGFIIYGAEELAVCGMTVLPITSY